MRKTDIYSLRHQHQRSADDADQTEFRALQLGTAVIGSGFYDDRVASAVDDFRGQGPESASWAEDDLVSDAAVGAIHKEIERRIELLPSAYPFKLEAGGGLNYTPCEHNIYELLLATTLAPSLTRGPFVQLPRSFERLASQLVGHYFGTDLTIIHTGSPRDAEVGIRFTDAMNHVCKECNEPTWHPRNDLPKEPDNGDAGVDFVLRKLAPDARPIGQFFVLGQCACGNDWQTKFQDLSLKKFLKWFNPFSLVDPIRVFATPYHVTEGWLYESSREAGVIFDRSRLAAIASGPAARKLVSEWKERADELIDLVRSASLAKGS